MERKKIKEKEIGNLNNDSFNNRNFIDGNSSGISYRENLFDQFTFFDDKDLEIEDNENKFILSKR